MVGLPVRARTSSPGQSGASGSPPMRWDRSGAAGPNKDSAFHVVGESFDALYPEGAAEALSDVQTTLVPPGGATMAEMKLEAPGHYMIEDHHVGRLEKGAMAHLEVEGAPNPTVFEYV